MEKYGFVYVTENLVNGKKYIGQRSYLKSGWESYLGSGRLLLKAIKKYGRANFKRAIISEACTREELDELEKALILERNAVADDDYYNLVPGGHGVSMGFAGKKHSAETREKMRNSALGHPVCQKTRDAVSKGRRGHIKSLETLKKLGDACRGHKHWQSKSVTIDGVRYQSMTEDRKQTGLGYAAVLAYFNEEGNR